MLCAYLYSALFRPGDCTTEEHLAGFGLYFDYFQILNSYTDYAHVAGHAETRDNALCGGVADRPRGAEAVLLAVGLRAAAEVVALNDTRETVALRDTCDVYKRILDKNGKVATFLHFQDRYGHHNIALPDLRHIRFSTYQLEHSIHWLQQFFNSTRFTLISQAA